MMAGTTRGHVNCRMLHTQKKMKGTPQPNIRACSGLSRGPWWLCQFCCLALRFSGHDTMIMQSVPDSLSRNIKELPAGGNFVRFLVFLLVHRAREPPCCWVMDPLWPTSLGVLACLLVSLPHKEVLEHKKVLLEELIWTQYTSSCCYNGEGNGTWKISKESAWQKECWFFFCPPYLFSITFSEANSSAYIKLKSSANLPPKQSCWFTSPGKAAWWKVTWNSWWAGCLCWFGKTACSNNINKCWLQA